MSLPMLPEAERDRWFRFIVGGTVLLMLLWASWNLLDSPRPWLDEGIYLQAARHLAETGRFGIVTAPDKELSLAFVTVGYPVLVPVAATFKLFGATLLVGRLVALAFLAWTVLAASVFVRRLYGRWAGIWAALLIATFPPLFGNGKNLLGEVPGLAYVFTALALVAAWHPESVAKRRPWLTGIFFGLAVASKPSFLPLIPAAMVGVLLTHRVWRTAWRDLLKIDAAFVLSFGVWVATQFQGTPISEIGSHYANPYGLTNMAEVVLANVKGFFTHPTPWHFLLLAGLALVGVWRRGFRKLGMAEWVLGGFVALTWASYFRTAGWYRYFFLAHVPLLAYAPAVLRRSWPKVSGYVCAFLLLVNLGMLAHDPSPMYGSHWRGMRALIESPEFPKDTLYLTAPELAFFHRDEQFRQFIHITDSKQFGLEELSRAMEHPPSAIVVGTPTPEILPLLERFHRVQDIGNYQYWVSTSTRE